VTCHDRLLTAQNQVQSQTIHWVFMVKKATMPQSFILTLWFSSVSVHCSLLIHASWHKFKHSVRYKSKSCSRNYSRIYIFTLPRNCGIGDLPDVAAEIQQIIVRRGMVQNIGWMVQKSSEKWSQHPLCPKSAFWGLHCHADGSNPATDPPYLFPWTACKNRRSGWQ